MAAHRGSRSDICRCERRHGPNSADAACRSYNAGPADSRAADSGPAADSRAAPTDARARSACDSAARSCRSCAGYQSDSNAG